MIEPSVSITEGDPVSSSNERRVVFFYPKGFEPETVDTVCGWSIRPRLTLKGGVGVP